MSEPQRVVTVERPPSHGCLWGCLGVLLIVVLPLIVMWGYGAWFLYSGFRTSPMMRAAIELTQKDGLAQRVLGVPITVAGVQGNAFSFVPGIGARNAYVLQLNGSKASGTLSVTAHTQGSQAKIDTMMLTGPDGRQYDLLHHAPIPAEGGADQPI